MTTPVVLVFKTGDPVVERHFTCQPAFRKKLQRAIHRGEADPRILLGHEPVKFVSREMFAGFEEGAQDRVPLLGVLQTNLLEVAVQDLLGLAHALARDHRLVVNAFLQHRGADLQPQDTIAVGHFENENHFQFARRRRCFARRHALQSSFPWLLPTLLFPIPARLAKLPSTCFLLLAWSCSRSLRLFYGSTVLVMPHFPSWTAGYVSPASRRLLRLPAIPTGFPRSMPSMSRIFSSLRAM